jgi:hypothetical protein
VSSGRVASPALLQSQVALVGTFTAKKGMWQVWQASGLRASAVAKVCRVWQLLHLPSSRPMLWHAPQPRSAMTGGSLSIMGMAFIATQAAACLPWENCSTWGAWQGEQFREETCPRTRLSAHFVDARRIGSGASFSGM